MATDTETIRRAAAEYEKAWNSGDPKRVAAAYAEDGTIVINRGVPWVGRAGIAAMAAGFYGDVDEMRVMLDDLRIAGDHAAFIWTFTGRHSGTGHALDVKGWEEWDIDAEGRIRASCGWFDAEDYARQVAGG